MVPPGYTNVRARSPRIFFLSWSSSHLLSSHIFFSLSLQLVTQIQGHIAGSSTPFPLRYVPSFLSREDSSLFLPSSTRIESTHAARCSQQLNPAQQYKGPDLKHKMLRWYKPDVCFVVDLDGGDVRMMWMLRRPPPQFRCISVSQLNYKLTVSAAILQIGHCLSSCTVPPLYQRTGIQAQTGFLILRVRVWFTLTALLQPLQNLFPEKGKARFVQRVLLITGCTCTWYNINNRKNSVAESTALKITTIYFEVYYSLNIWDCRY